MKKNILLAVILSGLLAACGADPVKPEQKEEPKKDEQQQTKPVANSKSDADPLNDPNSMLAKRSVYYPMDVSVVQGGDRAVVEAHAKYLAAHSGAKVRVEGNCDERGSNEYNLALGQRRAEGVRKLLQAGGASASQIETASNGEEQPKQACHAEKCWQENRRSDLIYGR